jgi:prophage DNA circulation protein
MNAVPPGIAGLLGLNDAGSSWNTRLREAAYTGPKGTRIKFLYEELSREIPLRGTIWEFPGIDDAYVQRRGFSARQYPVRAIFAGKDHDLIATAYEVALCEAGTGKLEHPMYGTISVVPVQAISRTNDMVDGLNVSVVSTVFSTTTGAVYPSATANGKNELTAAIEGFNVAVAQQLRQTTDLRSAYAKANFKATVRAFLKKVNAAMARVSNTTADIRREFADAQALVQETLDTFVGGPLLLAQQISNLIQAPGRALAGIEAMFESYGDLAQNIFGSPQARPGPALVSGSSIPLRRTKISNDFHAADLFATNAVVGSVVAAQNATFATRPEAARAAVTIAQQHDAAVTWRDGGFTELGGVAAVGAYQVDPGATAQALREAVAVAAGYLLQSSFSLAPEREFTLDRDRSLLDVAAELYGAVDSRLDLLIDSNALTGAEILELKRGRVLKFYRAA